LRHAEIDALAVNAREALRILVRVGPTSELASYVAEVALGGGNAETFIVAYLDDI